MFIHHQQQGLRAINVPQWHNKNDNIVLISYIFFFLLPCHTYTPCSRVCPAWDHQICRPLWSRGPSGSCSPVVECLFYHPFHTWPISLHNITRRLFTNALINDPDISLWWVKLRPSWEEAVLYARESKVTRTNLYSSLKQDKISQEGCNP